MPPLPRVAQPFLFLYVLDSTFVGPLVALPGRVTFGTVKMEDDPQILIYGLTGVGTTDMN